MMQKIWHIQQRWQTTSRLPLRERIKGFTLIELLVVVAIIGLLAAIVIVPLNIARTKGSNARNLETDAAMYHNLGDSLVYQALMDDDAPSCSHAITSVQDSSGYGNNGMPSSPAPSWSTNTPFGTGCSLSLGGTSYVTVASPATLDLTSGLTISAWVYLNSSFSNGYESIVGKWNDSTPRSYLLGFGSAGVGFPNAIFWLQGNITSPVSSAHGLSYFEGGWHFFVGVYDAANARQSIYVDGKLDGSASFSGLLTSNSRALMIGNHTTNNSLLNGNIDNVRIYDRALDTSEIQKLYAMGAMKHGYAFVGNYSPLGETTPSPRGYSGPPHTSEGN